MPVRKERGGHEQRTVRRWDSVVGEAARHAAGRRVTGSAGGRRRGDEMAAVEVEVQVEVGKAIAHAVDVEPWGVRAQRRRQVSGEPVIGSGEIAGPAGDHLRLLECAQSRPARQIHQEVLVAVGTGLTGGDAAQDAKGCWGRCAERRREGSGGAACHARLEASALSDLGLYRTRAQPCLSKRWPDSSSVATISRLDQGWCLLGASGAGRGGCLAVRRLVDPLGQGGFRGVAHPRSPAVGRSWGSRSGAGAPLGQVE